MRQNEGPYYNLLLIYDVKSLIVCGGRKLASDIAEKALNLHDFWSLLVMKNKDHYFVIPMLRSMSPL